MNIQKVLKMYVRDKWGWFLIPNIMLFSIFIINLIVSLFITTKEQFYTGGVSYIFVYMLVMGILVVAQTFSYAVSMSVRRTDYFIGTVAMGSIMNFSYGVLLLICSTIENWTNGWGGKFHFFHFPYLNDGTLLEQFAIYFIVFINLFFLGFMISSFYRRYGKKGMVYSALIILVIASIAVLLIHYYAAWMDIFHWFATHTAVQIAYWLIIPTLFYIAFSYLFLKRATV
ncbi:hypothetical protein ACFFF5_18965 [Lederbergia wuyishanensis]|uniref:ABC transporter permease n=1 Tax=Lederbergia wuyishanensis TaxID=1347903 RepID=A0ABU0D5H7_9BACI|nr:hypothetical protein [Lederbergia wuyishanensis]MCJ8009806.1 hypothetical protein [Lederbergia wuyishanensis]MDQ0343662.1 hypothetical protein [Lederbergia wuyishanensis]